MIIKRIPAHWSKVIKWSMEKEVFDIVKIESINPVYITKCFILKIHAIDELTGGRYAIEITGISQNDIEKKWEHYLTQFIKTKGLE